MAGYIQAPTRTFEAGGAIAQHLLVKLSTGKLAVAGATDDALGTMEDAAYADGDIVAVRLRTAEGTKKMVASKSIALGAKVYQATGGKVTDSSGGGALEQGTAMDAAGADNDVIEVLPKL